MELSEFMGKYPEMNCSNSKELDGEYYTAHIHFNKIGSSQRGMIDEDIVECIQCNGKVLLSHHRYTQCDKCGNFYVLRGTKVNTTAKKTNKGKMKLTIIEKTLSTNGEIEFYAHLNRDGKVIEIGGAASYVWEDEKYSTDNPEVNEAGYTYDNLSIEEASIMINSVTYSAVEAHREILADSVGERCSDTFTSWELELLEYKKEQAQYEI
jgi:hypothetical protein